jgi:hypothetical protein
MDRDEILLDLFHHPGWKIILQEVTNVLHAQTQVVMDSARTDASDRYEVGRYDGTKMMLERLEELRGGLQRDGAPALNVG